MELVDRSPPHNSLAIWYAALHLRFGCFQVLRLAVVAASTCGNRLRLAVPCTYDARAKRHDDESAP